MPVGTFDHHHAHDEIDRGCHFRKWSSGAGEDSGWIGFRIGLVQMSVRVA